MSFVHRDHEVRKNADLAYGELKFWKICSNQAKWRPRHVLSGDMPTSWFGTPRWDGVARKP